jgi:hypothetical protein
MSNAVHQPAEMTALRLYFPAGSRQRATRFWHRLSAPALAQHLLAIAGRADIAQALLYPVTAGYLPGKTLSHHHPDVTAMRHPQCLELLDTETRLRAFLHDHADELGEVRAVLFLCELPLAPRPIPGVGHSESPC